MPSFTVLTADQKRATREIAENMASSDRMHRLLMGDVGTGKTVVALFAMCLGCDLVHVAREAMLAVGCIQALKCHTGHCPSGVATQNWWLEGGLDVEDKAQRMGNYIRNFRKELVALALSAGYEHPLQFVGEDIEFSTGVNKFSTLTEVLQYQRDSVRFTKFADYALTP